MPKAKRKTTTKRPWSPTLESTVAEPSEEAEVDAKLDVAFDIAADPNKKNAQKRPTNRNHLKTLARNRENLKTCGLSLIANMMTMMMMRNGTQMYDRLSAYMDEFFKKPEVLGLTMEWFPEPFRKYKSHLPSRTPFSILLHMMEILHGTEEEIIDALQTLLEKLKFPNPLHKPGSTSEKYYTLEAKVICVCYSDAHPQRYYGASLSCRKGNAKRILIDASCLQTWHEFISHAVMSFTLSPPGDGITFPESVKCQAYSRDWKENVYVYKEKPPCLNCKELFNLRGEDKEPHHPYGNCAETEGLSKLLLWNQDIRENIEMENHTEENLERLRTLTKKSLSNELCAVGIHMDHENIVFYNHA